VSEPVAVELYRGCEQITRRSAANFYYGIRLLPADKRRAMCAVYAFARRIDDIGDGPMEPARKLELLADAERSLGALEPAGVQDPPPAGARHAPPARAQDASPADMQDADVQAIAVDGDAILTTLADAQARFALPTGALHDLIDGVRMDVEDTRYATFAELTPYCRRVAGSIGRLCMAIFDARADQRMAELADDLGVAMQLTNILRDVREDARRGRVYLPDEDLVRYQLSLDGRFDGEEGQFEAFMRYQAARADEWFVRGLQIVPLLDRRSAACVLAMSGIYRRLLRRIEAHPELTMRERVALPAWEKAWVAAHSLLGALR
jgi:15-cis-phytoene synthase